MSLPYQPTIELIELLQVIVDGVPTPEQHHRLEGLICDDEDARLFYSEFMQLHAMLGHQAVVFSTGERFADLDPDEKPTACIDNRQASIKPISTKNSFPKLHFVVAVSAITLLFWAGLLYVIQTSSPATKIAAVNVTFTQDALWQTGATRYDVGDMLRTGDRLDLALGFVELTFGRGEKIVVQGPAALSVVDAKTARLDRGKALAQVGPGGKGFTILTPSVRVVDLGTRFGVQVSGQGRVTEIQVFKGVVRVTPTATGVTPFSRRLGAGKALRVDQSSDSGNRPRYAVTQRPADKRAFAALASVMTGSSVAKDETLKADEVAEASFVRQQPLIASVHVKNGDYEIVPGGMREDAEAFTDRQHQWNGKDKQGMPAFLLGGDLIKLSTDSKNDRAFRVEVKVTRPSIVYLLFPDHVPSPAWLPESFEDTGLNLGVDEFGPPSRGNEKPGIGPGVEIDNIASIWTCPLNPADVLVTGPIDVSMYGLCIVESP